MRNENTLRGASFLGVLCLLCQERVLFAGKLGELGGGVVACRIQTLNRSGGVFLSPSHLDAPSVFSRCALRARGAQYQPSFPPFLSSRLLSRTTLTTPSTQDVLLQPPLPPTLHFLLPPPLLSTASPCLFFFYCMAQHNFSTSAITDL